MAIDSPASSTLLEEGGSNRMLEEPRRRDDAMHGCEGEEEVDVREAEWVARRKRPLVGRVAAKPTMGWQIEEAPRSWAGLFQRHHFAGTQPGAVDERESRLVFEVACGGDEPPYFIGAERDR
jgi:hypothetical protein